MTTESQVERSSSKQKPRLAKVVEGIWYVIGFVEVVIGLRVLLKILAANPQAGFAQFVYGMSSVLLAPFSRLVNNPSFNGAVLEVTSLIAMLVYALIGWGLVRLAVILFAEPGTSTSEVRHDTQ